MIAGEFLRMVGQMAYYPLVVAVIVLALWVRSVRAERDALRRAVDKADREPVDGWYGSLLERRP